MYMYTNTCMCIYIYIYTIFTSIHIHVCTYIHTLHMLARVFTRARIYVCTYMHIYIVPPYINIYIHICTYIRMYMQVSWSMLASTGPTWCPRSARSSASGRPARDTPRTATRSCDRGRFCATIAGSRGHRVTNWGCSWGDAFMCFWVWRC